MKIFDRYLREDLAKYIKNYKFNSIFVKNLISLLLLIIVPLTGIIGISYYSFVNIQKNEITAYSVESITKISSSLDEIIKEAKSQLIYMAYNADIKLFLIADNDNKDTFYNINIIDGIIKMPILSKEYVKSIYIYAPKSNMVISRNGMQDYGQLMDNSSINNFYNDPNKRDSYWFDITTKSDSDDEKQLSLYYPIKAGSYLNGVIIMNIGLAELGQQLSGSKIHITDNQKIIYSPIPNEIGQPVSVIKSYVDIIQKRILMDGSVIVSSRTSDETGLTVVSYSDTQSFQSKLINIKSFMVLFIFIMIFITIALCLSISINIFNPIKSIITTLEQNKPDLIGDVRLSDSNELKYITNTIIKTIDKSKDIEIQLEERIRLLKKSQSIALQSQINPHFFNNTLETINWLAIKSLGQKNDISFISEALSGMLRASLESADTFVTIEREIKHVQLYVDIQKKRYNDKFELIWNIDNEILNCKTIKIILQPIVENAIYHGIKPLTGNGSITISGKIIDSIINIVISDNGIGMTTEELMLINKQLKTDLIKESAHIGLSNVNQRLKLYFGEEFGVVVNTNEEMGTEVILKFPKIE